MGDLPPWPPDTHGHACLPAAAQVWALQFRLQEQEGPAASHDDSHQWEALRLRGLRAEVRMNGGSSPSQCWKPSLVKNWDFESHKHSMIPSKAVNVPFISNHVQINEIRQVSGNGDISRLWVHKGDPGCLLDWNHWTETMCFTVADGYVYICIFDWGFICNPSTPPPPKSCPGSTVMDTWSSTWRGCIAWTHPHAKCAQARLSRPSSWTATRRHWPHCRVSVSSRAATSLGHPLSWLESQSLVLSQVFQGVFRFILRHLAIKSLQLLFPRVGMGDLYQ